MAKKEASAVGSDKAKQGAAAGVRRGPTRSVRGVVVSDKMTKTVVISVTRFVRHPVYGKFVRSTKKFVAHDEKEQCDMGDLVSIVETRPLSRTKHWRVSEILRKAEA